MMPSLPETDLAYKTGTITGSWYFVFLTRECCCKQHIHIQKNWHEVEEEEEDEADRYVTQQIGPGVQIATQIKRTISCLC